jgi:hypothetical protein
MLRYSLRIRQGWDTTPQVNAKQMEIEHIYRGRSPANWLMVSTMDNADPTSDMKNWVEVVGAVTGFPVQAMQQNLNPPPELIDWRYEGQFPYFSEMLGVEEIHAYTGMAKIPGNFSLLSHIYILLARRKNFAWKVTLAFESAVLPGMPENIIAANDHVRAGATLGSLRLLIS